MTGLIMFCLLHIGLKFWKIGSRKIFAVFSVDLKKVGHMADSCGSDYSDGDPPPKKHKMMSGAEFIILERNVATIKNQVESLLNVQETLKLPLGFRRLLLDNFRCMICQGIMSPPIIFAKCCKRILGCEACGDAFYGGEGGMTKQCPQCRSERAYADTCPVHGIRDIQ